MTSGVRSTFLAVLLIVLVPHPPKADSSCRGRQAEAEIASNTVYAEAGGPGLQYSVNYESHFACRVFGRVGVSPFVPLPTATVVAMHFQVGALIGGESSNLELGIGASPAYSVREGNDPFFHVLGTATIGFRYMPTSSGMLFRVGFTPYFAARRVGQDGAIRLILPWGGVSMGYVFWTTLA